MDESNFYGKVYPRCIACERKKSREFCKRLKIEWDAGERVRIKSKRCPSCRQILPAEMFYSSSVTTHGLTARCRRCVGATMSDYYRNTLKQHMVYRARRRAKKKGLVCDITEADFDIPDRCPALGVEFEIGAKNRTGPNDLSPTLDRINNDLGYTKGNIVVVSHFVNRLKTNATFEQLLQVVKFYAALMGKRMD